MWISGGRECQEEGTASAKAQRWEYACVVPEMVKSCYLEGSEQGDKNLKENGGVWVW